MGSAQERMQLRLHIVLQASIHVQSTSMLHGNVIGSRSGLSNDSLMKYLSGVHILIPVMESAQHNHFEHGCQQGLHQRFHVYGDSRSVDTFLGRSSQVL